MGPRADRTCLFDQGLCQLEIGVHMKRIIVAIDDSVPSDKALTTALRLGRGNKAHVTAIVIRDPAQRAAPRLEPATAMIMSQAQHMGVEADATVRRGSPSTVIASLADELEPHLVVVPAHLVEDLRRGLLQRPLNGRTQPVAIVVPHERTIEWRHLGRTASANQEHESPASSPRPRDAPAASAPASARRAARAQARSPQGFAASTHAEMASR